jgi:uncharacterized transporter YbjL
MWNSRMSRLLFQSTSLPTNSILFPAGTNTILLALVICASIASASVSVTFSDADREAVHGLLSKALSNDKLASLKTVYQAVEALKALSLQAPGKACVSSTYH